MADRSAIEWTDATWNPIRARNKASGKVGWHCEHLTTGCEHCYAEGFNARLGTGLPFKPGHRKDIELFLDENMLTQPLRWKKPRTIFVGSMTDLFADFVPDEMLDEIFATIGACDDKGLGHIFQLLTKRSGRLLVYMRDRAHKAWNRRRLASEQFPPRNVWLGVSAERQDEADARIPHLLAAPAAVRFVSIEPMLGPINLEPWLPWPAAAGEVAGKAWGCQQCDGGGDCDCPGRKACYLEDEGPLDADGAPAWLRVERLTIDWIIVGGESGRQARAMHPDWARSLRDQCKAAGVPFFFKQWGEWAPSTPEQAAGNPRSGWCAARAYPRVCKAEELYPESGAAFVEHVGKARAGRMLDGELHDDLPNKGEISHGL
jgi:protein gp37